MKCHFFWNFIETKHISYRFKNRLCWQIFTKNTAHLLPLSLSSFTHTDHQHTVLTVLLPLRCPILLCCDFTLSSDWFHPILSISSISWCSGQAILCRCPWKDGWSGIWLFGEWRGVRSHICRTISLPLWDVGVTSPYTYTCVIPTSCPMHWQLMTEFKVS